MYTMTKMYILVKYLIQTYLHPPGGRYSRPSNNSLLKYSYRTFPASGFLVMLSGAPPASRSHGRVTYHAAESAKSSEHETSSAVLPPYPETGEYA